MTTVKAKDAKAGQWYDTIDGDRYLCIQGTRMANEAGVIVFLRYDVVLIHLPNCDGWYWRPPKPEPKYRPFSSLQEWWPHRDRWYRDREGSILRGCWLGPASSERDLSEGAVFLHDDGTDAEPFGVRVEE